LKKQLALEAEGLPLVWHGSFEPITTLSYFKTGRWKTWCTAKKEDIVRIEKNYTDEYPGAQFGFDHTGISIGRNVPAGTEDDVKDVAEIVGRVCGNGGRLGCTLIFERIESSIQSSCLKMYASLRQ
jgi:hypothetical protein